MSSSLVSISCKALGKSYRLFRRPSDRLWAFLWPRNEAWSKSFVALQDINFEMSEGEVLGVIGLNGAGKSTLLQLITGTLKPTSGTVSTRGRIAAILELGSGFNPDFTGRENIFLNAATLGLSRDEIEARLDAIIDFSGIGGYIDQPVKTYSSGMQIRLAFSIATSVDPDILIIDEALSVGDGSFSRKSFDRIMEIKQRGTTILFCSHVLFHIDTFCDRALWIHQGKRRALGDAREVVRLYQDFLDSISSTKESLDAEEPLLNLAQNRNRLEHVTVLLDGISGTDLRGISGQANLTAEIEFLSDPALPCPTVAIVISHLGGRIVGSSSTLSHALAISRESCGKARVRFRIPKLMLNRGLYQVGVYLFCERGLHGYDMRDPVTHLEMQHEGVEQGAWLLEGKWETP